MKLASVTSKNEVEGMLAKLKGYLLEVPNVQFAFVFGSNVKGKQRRDSDLDVAIFFNRPPEGLDLLHYVNRLSDVSGKEVHLVVLNNASPLLRHQVVKYGIRLIIKDEALYNRFREKTITDYDEYKYVSGMSIYD